MHVAMKPSPIVTKENIRYASFSCIISKTGLGGWFGICIRPSSGINPKHTPHRPKPAKTRFRIPKTVAEVGRLGGTLGFGVESAKGLV
jgi:hypothetical protein